MNLHDFPYSRLLQVPDEEREYLTLEELKPHQLTELGLSVHNCLSDSSSQGNLDIQQQQQQQHHQQQQQQQQQQQLQFQSIRSQLIPPLTTIINVGNHHVISDTSQHQDTAATTSVATTADQFSQIYYDLNAQHTTNGSCHSSMYMANNDMTQTGHHADSTSVATHLDSSAAATATATVAAGPATSATTASVGTATTDISSTTSGTTPPTVNNNNSNSNNSSGTADTSGNNISHQHQSLHSTTDQTSPPHSEQKQQQQKQQYLQNQKQNSYMGSSRKRKCTYNETSDLDEDDAKSVKTTDESKKQNHSEIEKRRRDKMNTYITELSSMVPMCHAMSRKLDKLTVLRMAVQHLKTIRGAVHSYTEGHYKPAFLSDQELKMLILQAAEGFLFVVGCDRGRILYVSESVSQVLNYTQGDLLGQSWFDILHPKDVAKVKEQLSSSDLSPRERLIDAKTMLPVKTDLPQGLSRLCPGARRSFFCRMKCKVAAQIKEESDSSTSCHRRKKQLSSDKRYSVIQCTGYLKSWAPAKIGLEEQETDADGDSCNLSCLVAVGRIPPNVFAPNISPPVNNYPNLRSIQFISRHAMDGKFLFVDQRATLVLGFLPQELLGTSMYEYYHQEDIPGLAESHKIALQASEKITTLVYRFRTKDNGFIRLQSDWKSFKNPWTKDVEYLIAKNSVILNDCCRDNNGGSFRSADGGAHVPGNFDFFNQNNGREIHRIINTHVEASKIGRQIAEQVLDYQRRVSDSSAESSPDPDSRSGNPSINISSSENSISGGEIASDRRISQSSAIQRPNGMTQNFSHVRNTNNFISSSENTNDGEITISGINSSSHDSTTAVNQVTNDGNDEAAMAVIMSLLEADAGLGGPVDFTGLPWPLP